MDGCECGDDGTPLCIGGFMNASTELAGTGIELFDQFGQRIEGTATKWFATNPQQFGFGQRCDDIGQRRVDADTGSHLFEGSSRNLMHTPLRSHSDEPHEHRRARLGLKKDTQLVEGFPANSFGNTCAPQ